MLFFLLAIFLWYKVAFSFRVPLDFQKASLGIHSSKQNDISVPNRKILFVVEPTPFNYISGYANRFKETLKHLHDFGDRVEIITSDRSPNPPDRFHDYPISTNRGFRLPVYNSVVCSFDFDLRIKKVVQRFRPDIIHVSAPSACVLPTLLWARKFNIPVLTSYHTDLLKYSQQYLNFPGSRRLFGAIVRSVLRQADLVLATSTILENDLKTLGVDLIDVWRKGVNTEIFSPDFYDSSMRSRLATGNHEDPVLLYVGRLGREKRIDRLKAILETNPRYRLALVGEGPAEASLRSHFRDLPVNFMGPLRGLELSQAFASADVFVMPSNTETLGFVVMEALASGLPTVGVEAGGLIDLIESGSTGYLVPDNDDMTLFTRRVQELLSRRNLNLEIRGNARRKALSWNWKAATAHLRNHQYPKAIVNCFSREPHSFQREQELLREIHRCYPNS